MGQDIFFLFIIVLFYFIYRIAIYGNYRLYLHYRIIKKQKFKYNKFYRLTGIYLLFINKGQSKILKISIILTNIELLFIPINLVMIIYKTLKNNYIKEIESITRIMAGFILFIGVLISIHYLLYIRFNKK